MKKSPLRLVVLFVFAVAVYAAAPRFAPLPKPFSNNAVASLKIGKRALQVARWMLRALAVDDPPLELETRGLFYRKGLIAGRADE